MNTRIIVAVTLVAIAVGLVASYSLSEQSYTERLEDQIRSNQNFTGSVECFPPGAIEVNLSDQVKNNTELKSVCRIITNGQVQILPITYSR